jgi:hypothetical protein
VTSVLVPLERLARWITNFEVRHGPTALTVADGALTGSARDGSSFWAYPPLDERYVGDADVESFMLAIEPSDDWGVLLVRKGGFAVGRVARDQIVESKVGQRHVQGRTKAGGQSQQRFARRRDNQARQAYEAAAEHAVRILGQGPLTVVTGGDRSAVEEVLADPRLARVRVVDPWLPVPDPRRAVLEQAVRDACAVRIEVDNAEGPG